MPEQIDMDFGVVLSDGLTKKNRKHYKRCIRCGLIRHVTHYSFSRSKKDKKARRADCKTCQNKAQIERYHGRPTITREILSRKAVFRRNRTARIGRLKQRMGCIDCGYNQHFAALQFDHIDLTTKVSDVSSMLRRKLKDIFAEIRKCEVRCANCHAVKTHENREHMKWRDELGH